MTLTKFHDDIVDNAAALEEFISIFASDQRDQSDLWSDDANEFLEKFEACVQTAVGRDFILFLVGHESLETYLEYTSTELNLYDPEDSDDDDVL